MVDIPKRTFIAKLAAAGVALPAALATLRDSAFAQAVKSAPLIPQQQPQGPPPPGTGSDAGPIVPGAVDPKAMLKQHQLQIRTDIEKLYDLAGELKAEAEKTQTEHVLSLAMVQKAEQVEKLAKQIKSLARDA